ncbi:MAG TPA: outer membrane beta-barrel protein, partial [Flavisolibacter sp.]
MFLRRFTIGFIFSMLMLAVQAQQDVRIQVVTAADDAAAGATVELVAAADSMMTRKASVDTSGHVMFMAVPPGQYIISVTSVNFTPVRKGITVKENSTFFRIVLQQLPGELSRVVITATRPLMRQEDDKTIVDPEALAATSTNAYEILEKTPGLFVDQDGNIYLTSTTPATLYINGREQRMSAADVATMLKNLPPNSIASIEILRTPSARYDASGSGGIVNVVLKKGVRIGLTGSVTVGGNQGNYGNQFAGINVNNNNGRTTTYLNLQVGSRNNHDKIMTDRRFTPDSVLSQDAFTVYKTRNAYIGYGLNTAISPSWDFSYDGRFSISGSDNRSSNLSMIREAGSTVNTKENRTTTHNHIDNYNISQSLNLKFRPDTIGSEWTTDLSVNFSPSGTEQLYATYFMIPLGGAISGEGDISNRLTFYAAQTNYLKKLPGKISLEAGAKTSGVVFHNSTDYFRTWNGVRTKDEFRTGSYRYDEQIHAGYLQASKTFAGFILKLGSRLENTNMNGQQVTPNDTSFSIHRTDLFPYAYLSRYLMKIAGYELRAYLVYRRTINRPAYEYLNPSLRFVDPYLVETGNPRLRPQFTRNYEANISVDERPIIAIGVNETTDIFTQVVYQADSSREQAYRTYDNLGKNKELYFRALGAIPPGKKYFFVAGGQYNHNMYDG